MINPANSIIGITHQVSFAPPVSQTSTIFIAASIEIIEINDMPIAVLNAATSAICRDKITVSSAIEVNNPLTIASIIMASVGQAMPVNWKNAMVPKSPMEQPSKHHSVFFAAIGHVWRQRQLIDKCSVVVVINVALIANCLPHRGSSNWNVKNG